jgi:ankyrin repeat protein
MLKSDFSRDMLDDRGVRLQSDNTSQLYNSRSISRSSPMRYSKKKLHQSSGGVVQEDDGVRPIHFASYHQNVPLLELLLNSGADPTLPNNKGLNVLHMAAQGDCPYSLILFKQNFENIR